MFEFTNRYATFRPFVGIRAMQSFVNYAAENGGTVLYLPTTLWLHAPAETSRNNQSKDKDREIPAPFIFGRFRPRYAKVDVDARWPPHT